MKKIKRTPLYTTANACFVTIFAALVTGAIIDSSGLKSWADKLDNGMLKTVATPATHAIDHIMSPLGFSEHRDEILTSIHKTDTWLTTPIHQRMNVKTDVPTSVQTEEVSQAEPIVSAQSVTPLEDVLTASMLENLPPAPLHTPFSPSLNELTSKTSLNIALVGDSMMAVGLAPSIQKHGGQHQFIRAYKSGTGLSRPDMFNWMAEYPKMLKGQTPDLAIISIGANDAQDYEIDGNIVKFGSTQWLEIYGRRMDEFANLVAGNGTKIIWIGMPRMKSGKFDKKIDQLNRLSYQIIHRYPNMTWWNASPHIDEIQGDVTTFREYGKNETGKNIRLRSNDGIHLATDGAELIAIKLFDWQDKSKAPPTTLNQ